MNHQVSDEIIDNFFSWLKNNLDNIFNNKGIQRELTQQLKLIHPELQWEIGPGLKERSFFAFSPNLDYKLLELTKKLAKCAPEIKGWEFLPAKPKKRWRKRTIKISTAGKINEVNCDEWQYYLTSFNNGEFFDVNIIPYNEHSLCDDDLTYAADLFVEFELGEELYIAAVDRVNIVSPCELKCETDDVQYMSEHVLSEWKEN